MGHSSSKNELDDELLRKVEEIERILGYTFRKKSLLVEAITHGSYPGHPSYQRLEFVGDAVLGLAVADYLYERYPAIDPGKLTLLRSANVSNENLARVAVRLGLYRFLRCNFPGPDRAVSKFTDPVRMAKEEEQEDDGKVTSKVLADMVESIAAAVYWDCDRNLKLVWKIFKKILHPFNTLDEQPVAEDDDGQNLRNQTGTDSGIIVGRGWANKSHVVICILLAFAFFKFIVEQNHE